MSLLLDTSVCIAAIRGNPPIVRDRLDASALQGHAHYVSSVTVFELWFGIGRGKRTADNIAQLEAFFAQVRTLHFDEEDARAAGLLRAQLYTLGQLIGPYDLLLAGQALRRSLKLITANVREFSRVPDLRWANWET